MEFKATFKFKTYTPNFILDKHLQTTYKHEKQEINAYKTHEQ